jgi:molybdate transport system permease protein
MDYEPLITSFYLAATTTVILLFICLPFSYWLLNVNNKIKIVIDSVASLPLVLPPTVLGFYILVVLSPNFFAGRFLKHTFNITLIFNYLGILFASCIASFPFMFQQIKSGVDNFETQLIESSYILGKSKFQTFIHVVIPNIKSSVIAGAVTCFAHTLGEFGVVLMIGGNIPGKTKVVSIAIYEKVEELDFVAANKYSLILLVISFSVLLSVQILNRKRRRIA